MGGGGEPQAPQRQVVEERLQIDPALQGKIQQAQQNLLQQNQGFQQSAQDAAGQFRTGFQQFQPSNQLDQFSQALVSQGRQGIQNQLAAQQRNVSRGIGRNNPALARVLNAQAAQRGALNQNPLLFQAAANQQGRDVQRFQLNQQAQNLGNAALGQRLQLQGAGLSAQNNLLGTLGNIASQTGTRQSVTKSGTDQDAINTAGTRLIDQKLFG